jgi:hypothetical protein
MVLMVARHQVGKTRMEFAAQKAQDLPHLRERNPALTQLLNDENVHQIR